MGAKIILKVSVRILRNRLVLKRGFFHNKRKNWGETIGDAGEFIKKRAVLDADRSKDSPLYQLEDQSTFSKYSFSAPHLGQTQSSGRSSKAVPGSIPFS